MDVNIINQFIIAADEVFKQVANISLKKEKVQFFETGEKFHVNVATLIGLTGELKGQIVFALNEPMAMKFASAIMMGMPVEEFNEMAESGVCEMANMIAGAAGRHLQEIGYTCDLTVPSLVRGTAVELGFTPHTPLFAVDFSTEWGPLKLIIRVESNKEKK